MSKTGSDISGIAAHDAVKNAAPSAQASSGGTLPSPGTDIGVIAAYDLATSQDAAAVSAEAARQQALASTSAAPAIGLDAARFEGAKMSGDVITWSFATGSGPADAPFSGTIGAAYKMAIEKAFQAWAAASGLTFEEVPDSASSDIRIGWGDFDTAASGVVGYTSFSQANGMIAPGTVIRLEDPNEDALVTGTDGQATYAGTQADLYQVALHEIGHALGLADSTDPNSVMYYASSTSNRTLDQTDIAGIKTLYGTTSTTGDPAPTPPAASPATTTAGGPAALPGSPGSLSALLASHQGPVSPGGGGISNPRLLQMVQAMGAVHDGSMGVGSGPHTPVAMTPEPPITIAHHSH